MVFADTITVDFDRIFFWLDKYRQAQNLKFAQFDPGCPKPLEVVVFQDIVAVSLGLVGRFQFHGWLRSVVTMTCTGKLVEWCHPNPNSNIPSSTANTAARMYVEKNNYGLGERYNDMVSVARDVSLNIVRRLSYTFMSCSVTIPICKGIRESK